jgi:DNA polymerase III epsilon subunit family exonuclease
VTAPFCAPPAGARPGALALPLRRVLDRIGARGEALALDELARQLFALCAPPPPELARRLVASALGLAAGALPEPLDPRLLPRLAAGPAADLALDAVEWIVVDLETTGLSHEACTILEIGAVRVAGGRLVARFQTLVDPGVPIPPRITALTGIDRSLVDGAPPLPAAMRAFHAWVGEGGAPVPFVAHNAGFDERFVRRALAEVGLPDWSGPVVCTRKLARRLLPELRRYDLDSLCAQFGVANHARHRALGDAEATARALVELLAIACTEHALATLGDLLALQARRAPPRRRARARAAAAGAPPAADGAS